MQAVADGAGTPAEAFLAAQRQEERPFLGDTIAFEYLAALPLRDSTCELTDEGARSWPASASGTAAPERWLGGVHLPAGASLHGATARGTGPGFAYDPS